MHMKATRWLAHRFGVAEISEGATGDGVEPQLVRLAVLVLAVSDDADGLPLSVGDLACMHTVPQYISRFLLCLYICMYITTYYMHVVYIVVLPIKKKYSSTSTYINF